VDDSKQSCVKNVRKLPASLPRTAQCQWTRLDGLAHGNERGSRDAFLPSEAVG
jgi:hypothetical protein